jgi:tetratricopeptide (TPR) repeat protein
MQSTDQRLTTAIRFHQTGRPAEAEALYRAILAEQPEHPDALHMLGLLAHQAGRHQEAEKLICQALAIHGPHPLYHANLGGVYLALGQINDAVAQCRKVIELAPQDAENHNRLGVALRRQGRLDEAATCFTESLRLDPNHVDARCNLSGVLQRQGKLPEAMALLQDAIRLAPGHARAHNNLGSVLIAAGLPDRALLHLQEAVRLRPNFAEAMNLAGAALRDMNRNEEAMPWFQQALQVAPNHAAARTNLAHTFETLGRIDEAVAHFEETLTRHPNDATALFGLTRLATRGHYHLTDEQLHHIEKLAERPNVSLDDRYLLHLTLAWAYDHAGEHERALSHCRNSKEIRRDFEAAQGRTHDPEAHARFIDHIIAAYPPAWFERTLGFGSDSELPIFIVGMMRSGTTLVEQILASHPAVHAAGELTDLGRAIGSLPGRLGVQKEFLDCLDQMDAELSRTLAEDYLKSLRQRGGPALRVVDKEPFNFLHVGFIAALFPKARIIHCRRDSVDTCMSAYFQNFAAPHPLTLDLRHLGLYYRDYERLMDHWRRVLPVSMFELQYEDLTERQEEISRQLLAYCGLPWDVRCLRFNETKRAVRTASALQVRQSMYRSSVGKWRRYEPYIRPLLEALGEKTSSPQAPPQSGAGKLQARGASEGNAHPSPQPPPQSGEGENGTTVSA